MKAIILILSIVVLTTSCGTTYVACGAYKSCHTKKYYVNKNIRKAQLRPRK